jgi:uncharacterized protein (DUF2141 family)
VGQAALKGMEDHSGLTVLLHGPASAGAVTKADGAFTFAQLPPGDYVVSVEAPATRERRASVAVRVDADSVTLPVIELSPLGSVSGTALLAGESSHEGLVVSAGGSSTVAVTDQEGRFTLQELPVGAARLSFSARGFLTAEADAAVQHGKVSDVLPITLSRSEFSGAIAGSGRILGAKNAQGLLVSLSGPSSAVSLVEDDGRFRFDGVPPGSYAVTMLGDRTLERTITQFVEVAAAEVTVPAFEFTGLGQVSGTVLLPDALTQAGILVSVPGTGRSSMTDDAGHFSLSDVPAGSHTLVFTLSGYVSAASDPIEVRYAETTAAEPVTLIPAPSTGTPLVRVEGIARRFDRQDSSGTVVTVVGTALSAVTDTSGHYAIDSVPAGIVTLQFVNGLYNETLPNVLALPGNSGAILSGGFLLTSTPLELQAGVRLASGLQAYPSMHAASAHVLLSLPSSQGRSLSVVSFDGRHRTVLADAGDGFGGSFTPDGTRVMYYSLLPSTTISTYDIFSQPVTGGAPTLIARRVRFSGLQPSLAISPDGSKVAFLTPSTGSSSDIYIAPTDGNSAPVKVGTTSTSLSFPITFSGDSSWLFWQRNFAVYSLPVTGGTPTVVAPYAVGGTIKLAPNGTRVLYSDGSGVYFSAPLDGGATVQLTGGKTQFIPSITPDGSRLVFGLENGDVFSVPLTGGTPIQLGVGDLGSFGAFAISADSTTVFWVTQGTLMKAPLLGDTPAEPLATNIVGTLMYPLPDAQHLITLISTPDGYAELTKIEVSSGARTVLASGVSPQQTSLASLVSPSPSGRYVAYFDGATLLPFVIPTSGGEPIAVTRSLFTSPQLQGYQWADDDTLMYLRDANTLLPYAFQDGLYALNLP